MNFYYKLRIVYILACNYEYSIQKMLENDKTGLIAEL